MCRAQGRRCPHSLSSDGKAAAAARKKVVRRAAAAAKYRAGFAAAHVPGADYVDLYAPPNGLFREVPDGLDPNTAVWLRVPRTAVGRIENQWEVPSRLISEPYVMKSCGTCGRWDKSPHRCRLKPTSMSSEIGVDQFPHSQIRDASGALKLMYHGSSVEFDAFDSAFTGSGNDTWGSGFYFTDNRDQASGYGGHVKTVRLDVRNPIRVDGKKRSHLDEVMSFTASQVSHLLRAHPDIYRQPDDEDAANPLGDYDPHFWDKDHWTSAELDRMIDGMARQYFNNAKWSTVEALFEGSSSQYFRLAVTEATGHDGVVVDFGDDGSFCIAWQPQQIHVDVSD